MPAKIKIYVALAVWLAVSASMLGYFFKILDGKNQLLLDKIAAQKKDMAFYQVEQESFQLSQKDLDLLASEPYPPEKLFSKDITLVQEIQELEDLGKRMNLNLQLSGISGVVKNAPKAKTVSDIAAVPYGISVTAPFQKVLGFVEVLENLDFATTLSSVSVAPASEGRVTASFTAFFYLRRQ